MLTAATSITLTESVIAQLLGLIRGGKLKPSDFLPSEKALAVQMGVSRPCVREALQAVASFGVIELRSGRRARVKPLSPHSIFDPARLSALLAPEDLLHLCQVREAIEVAAIRLAAQFITPAQLKQLERIVSNLSRQAEQSDLGAYVESDLAFHKCLIEATGNPIFVQVYEVISRAFRASVRVTGSAPGGMRRGLFDHKAILKELKAKNPQNAEKAMRSHLGSPKSHFEAVAGLPAQSAKESRAG